jgi:hypothetical protein
MTEPNFSPDLEQQRRDVHDLLVIQANHMIGLGGDPQTVAIAMVAAGANVLTDLVPDAVVANVLRQMADNTDRLQPRPKAN